jgi:hypothetical protein
MYLLFLPYFRSMIWLSFSKRREEKLEKVFHMLLSVQHHLHLYQYSVFHSVIQANYVWFSKIISFNYKLNSISSCLHKDIDPLIVSISLASQNSSFLFHSNQYMYC